MHSWRHKPSERTEALPSAPSFLELRLLVLQKFTAASGDPGGQLSLPSLWGSSCS